MIVRRRSLQFALLSGCVALLVALLASCSLGVAGLSASDSARELLSHFPGGPVSRLDALDASLLWNIRFPRVVLSAMVGGALGLCGCAYQGAFRNPLVDPYLLGSAAGAGLGATLAIVYVRDHANWPVDPLPLCAFIGALCAVGISYVVGLSASRSGRRTDSSVLVLAGIAVSSFFSAVQAFVQQRGNNNLRQVYSWIMGGLVTSGWSEVVLILPYLAVVSAVVLASGRYLDVLSVGDDEARTLGVRPERIRLLVVVAASLGTAAAVAVSGLIGFVGLVVPHVVRMLFGGRHRVSLPASALFGASFLTVADLIARTIDAPAEIPIGVITAFIGAPFFAMLLIRRSLSS
jgi:iron complex transport system permease protein